MSISETYNLSDEDVSRLIGMAWADDVPFEAIEAQYGVPEDEVVTLMRRRLKRSSWKLWRKRVSGRPTKHATRSRLSESTSRRPPGGRPISLSDDLRDAPSDDPLGDEPDGRPL